MKDVEDVLRWVEADPVDLAAKLLHTCLRISPTYALAHRKTANVADEVRDTYTKLGDVTVPFWQWEGVRKLVPADPPIEMLDLMERGDLVTARGDVDGDSLRSSVDEYIAKRRTNGAPAVAVFAIPLGLPVDESVAAIRASLRTITKQDRVADQSITDADGNTGREPVYFALFDTRAAAPFPLAKSGLSLATQQERLKLCVLKALHPGESNWQLAVRWKPHLATGKNTKVDARKPKGSKAGIDSLGRGNLGSTVSRDLGLVELLIENAARGLFPSTAKISGHMGYTDATYAEIGARLRALSLQDSGKQSKPVPPMWVAP